MIRREFLAGITSWVASLPIIGRGNAAKAESEPIMPTDIRPMPANCRKFVASQSYMMTKTIGHNGIIRIVTEGRTELLRSTPWPWDDRTAEALRREMFGEFMVIPDFKVTDITFSVDVFSRVINWRITHEPVGGYKP